MKNFAIISFLLASFSCCGQEKSQFDFISDNSIERFTSDTFGLLSFRGYYPKNQVGNTFGYMLHGNGGSWWYKEAKRRSPKDIQNCEFRFAKKLFTVERDSLNNYDKWVFFIDKKYLEIIKEHHGESGEPMMNAYTKENIPLEVILYQQLVGEKEWKEIERKKFKDENEYNKSSWRIDFYKQKLVESNLPKK